MSHEQTFSDLLLGEFPELNGRWMEYPNVACLSLAWHTQAALQSGNMVRALTYIAFVQGIWSYLSPELRDIVAEEFFAQLALRELEQELFPMLAPHLRIAWEQALATRGGELSKLDFLGALDAEWPKLRPSLRSHEFVLRAQIQCLTLLVQNALEHEDRVLVERAFAFMERFLISGVRGLRFALNEMFIEELDLDAQTINRLALPPRARELCTGAVGKRARVRQERIQAEAAAQARKAQNYPRIPESYRGLVLRLDELTGLEFQPGPEAELARLRGLGLPDSVLAFYACANPAQELSGSLFPAQRVGQEDDWCPSLSQFGLVAFAADFEGNLCVFDLQRSPDPQHPLVRKVSHDWGDPAEGVKRYLEGARQAGDTTSSDKALAKEHWESYWADGAPVIAKDLADFLQQWIQELEQAAP